ncbi:MAG: hypothetical protein GXP55_13800 [Deltaproteobacteria bacterium]|nr:hypothetical protein [Deltaproteobacteria bacterium]
MSLAEQIRAALSDAGLEGVSIAWWRGECRAMRDGRALARILPRERGGIHLELADHLENAAGLRASLTQLVEAKRDEWRRLAGELPWSLPFDRGPGCYPVREVDLGDVTSAILDPDRTWIAFLETSCLGDCIFCGHVESQSDGVPEALCFAAVRDGRTPLEGAYVCLGGPEPTLWPRLEDAVRLFADAGAETVTMIATGDALATADVGRRLVDAGLKSVSLPIYGATAATHEDIVRAPGAFARLHAAIDGAQQAGLEVFLHTIALEQNASELLDLAAWADARGLPLAAGLPRFKYGAGIPFFPAPEILRELNGRLRVLGVPPCLGPDALPTDLLRAHGPFTIYAHVQAGRFGDACSSCVERDRCCGLPSGLVDAWSSHLRAMG